VKLTDAFGLPPAPRHATTLWSQGPASARFGGAGGAYGVNDHPQSRYKLQPYFSSIDEPSQHDDLGKHFFHDFYVAQLQYNVPTGDLCTIDFTCRYLHYFDFCKLDGAETVNYDLELHIRRYSSSKLRNEKGTQAGVLAKSGVLTEKDKIAQNHILAMKCTNN